MPLPWLLWLVLLLVVELPLVLLSLLWMLAVVWFWPALHLLLNVGVPLVTHYSGCLP